MSSACLLTLTRPDGNSVRLDGAVVLSLDDRSVRIRTWKFNQPVFDLTLTPQGLWVEVPRESRRRGEVLPASVSAGQLARALSVFGGDFFDDPNARVIDRGGKNLEVRKPMDAGQTMTAVVDRATLTVRQYRLADASGVVHFTLALKDYQQINGAFWPTRLIARSDTGTIDAELRDVEINGELPPAAFVPPRGAEKLP
ncbi:MAG TPA: hypothetical protein VLJ39_06340 [Tepidisphaeraceae bacterium]|nr:hypothetical protein [Tepidisphaeraceae bacterium]